MIICLYSFDQFFFGKIGPRHRREVKLRISQLPEQEIGNTLLIAGADQKIRRRQTGRVQMGLDHILRDLIRGKFSPHRLLRDPADRTADLIPTAIIEGDLKMKPLIVHRGLFQFLDALPDILVQPRFVADDADAHIVLGRRL